MARASKPSRRRRSGNRSRPGRRQPLSPKLSPPRQQPTPLSDASDRRLLQVQVPAFTGDACLPMTMELAERFEEAIRPLLRRSDPKYSDDDRVLAWLCPRILPDIRRYYGGNGPCLRELLSPAALEALDKRLCWTLGRRLEQAYPGFLGWLSHSGER